MSTESNRSTAVPWRSKTVQVVLLSTLLAPFSVALISPGLPVFRAEFGTTDAGASLLLVAILVPGIFLSPLMGFLTDRVGRRSILVGSLVGWSLAGGLIVLRPPFAVVLGLRLAQGTALAGIGVTTITIISDVFEDVQRNAVLGMNTAVLSVGAAAFPIAGGALVTLAWHAPFAMYFLGLPVAVFAARVLEASDGDQVVSRRVYLRRVVSALSAREAVTLYGAAFVIDFLLFGAVFTALPFLLSAEFDLSPVLIGLVITTGEVASIVGATQNGRLATRLSDVGIIVVGSVATGIGLIGAWLAPSPLLIAVATLGYGGGWGLILPSIDAGVSDIVETRFRAGALSLRGTASFAGRAAGPVVFPVLAVQQGYRPLLLAAGVVALAFSLVIGALARL